MRPRRHGFTLIEVLASAVLAAMMLAGLFAVLWSAIRETNQLAKSEITRWPTTQLVAQLRRDFQNARGMAVTPSGVALHGFLDQDARSGNPTLRPGSVRYESIDPGGRVILIRSASGSGGSSGEPVWFGFGSLQIEPLEETAAEEALLENPVTGGLPPVPGSFRVTMLGDHGQVLWQEVIHHHAS